MMMFPLEKKKTTSLPSKGAADGGGYGNSGAINLNICLNRVGIGPSLVKERHILLNK